MTQQLTKHWLKLKYTKSQLLSRLVDLGVLNDKSQFTLNRYSDQELIDLLYEKLMKRE